MSTSEPTINEPPLFPYSAAPGQPIPFAAPAELSDLMAPDWAEALGPLSDRFHAIAAGLEAERRLGNQVLPAPENILRAFQRPMSSVKVLILGQDPYPTPGHAVGLSFSVGADVRPLPRSLKNIFAELTSDLGVEPGPSGDLSGWADQGVLLLNRVLTVRAGAAGSHRRKGWEAITERAVRSLAARRTPQGTPAPLVAVLWGRDAQSIVPFLNGAPTVESAHPSPLSASRGFFGSRPFSRVNELLAGQGAEPVDWAAVR